MANNSTHFYYTVDYMLSVIGTTLNFEYLYMCLNLPLGAIGFILNIICIVVIVTARAPEFNNPLYNYLLVYSINSAQINFINIFVFISNTPILFAWNNSYATQFFFHYIFTPLHMFGYFYSTMLDIFMALDRIVSMTPSLRVYMKLTPYQACLVGLIVCIIVNFPIMLVFQPGSFTGRTSATTTFTIWFPTTTVFSKTIAGKVITFTSYFVKDVLVLFIMIILSSISVHLLKKHLNKKARLVRKPSTFAGSNTNEHTSQTANRSDSKRVSTVGVERKRSSRTWDPSREAELRLTISVLSLCFLSMVDHSLNILTSILPIFSNNVLLIHRVYFFAILVVNFKHAINFILFYCLNKNFKSACQNFFRTRSISQI